MADSRHPVWQIVLGWVGLVGHIATALLYLGAGLIAPLYGIVALWIIWLGLLGLAIWLLRTHPAWTLAVPVASVLVFFGVIQVGSMAFGWTA